MEDNNHFTAEQAAQKKWANLKTAFLAFTAEQAAQKLGVGDMEGKTLFTAEQAAQKLVGLAR